MFVGTGPAGFYTAHHLLNKSSDSVRINLDFFERLPTPYGLSRYGVAPDHPEVKNCEEYLDDAMKTYSGEQENSRRHRVRFFGNVNIGEDISLKQLESYYNSIVLSYGSTSADNELNVPGTEFNGVVAARQFVNWYNGHPDYYKEDNKFVPPPLDKIEDVTIIGNGNVALDVARILLADPSSHWAKTDISVEALEVLKTSTVKNVNIVARRGLLESAFSNKEIRELFELSKDNNVNFIPLDKEEFESLDVSKLGRVDKRKVSIIEKYSKASADVKENGKTWSLRYLRSPQKFAPNPVDSRLLSSTEFVINELVHDPLAKATKVKATAQKEVIKNELVILSIGYKGSPLKGFEENGILFDKNRLLNKSGRILSVESKGEEDHNAVFKKGWYTSGWIKNGPKGVIATTMMDSFDTADRILEDLSNGIQLESSGSDITELLKHKTVIEWENWEKLNAYELEKGQREGKSRFKVCNANEMIKIACK
ncbi:uncharacterized protein RJT20DRAFT_135966 [Scheffersomyces xylosifermentans]|uniref:uncharacterized protein n=1 Tax=Scheffersomyces xylosifermentans TaxID=1304137 RepID=UPI00315CF552